MLVRSGKGTVALLLDLMVTEGEFVGRWSDRKQQFLYHKIDVFVFLYIKSLVTGSNGAPKGRYLLRSSAIDAIYSGTGT